MRVEVIDMQTALRMYTTILPDGKIEVTAPQLAPGKQVELISLLPEPQVLLCRSALDILREASGQRLFKTAEDGAAYLHEERGAWDN
jgi:hypothetical protein